MTNTRPDAVEVAQSDRDDAADYGLMVGRLTVRDAECVRRGEWDETKDVQFFARRRLAAFPTPDGGWNAAIEAAAKEVDFLTRIAKASPFWPNGCGDELEKVGARIRSLAAAAPASPPSAPADQMREAVSLVEAFEMGYSFAFDVTRPQSREDSRAVGRLLGSSVFDPIAKAIDAQLKERGFNSFQSADEGICAANRSYSSGARFRVGDRSVTI
jgi:hypothetical protein